MHMIAQAYLRCCKNERKPYWNTTCFFNLVVVVINTSFADAKKLLLLTCPIQLKIAFEFTRKIKQQIFTVQYTAQLYSLQVAKLSLTNPRDALHHNKRQNFKTVT